MCALTARITSVRTIAVRGIIITVIIADFRFDLNLTANRPDTVRPVSFNGGCRARPHNSVDKTVPRIRVTLPARLQHIAQQK